MIRSNILMIFQMQVILGVHKCILIKHNYYNLVLICGSEATYQTRETAVILYSYK